MSRGVDFVITGCVITVDPERHVYPDGAVAVDDGRIVDVGQRQEIETSYLGRSRLGGSRDIVMPGLIDTHNHMAQALVRGLALEDLPNIYRIYAPAEALTGLEGLKTSARVTMANLLKGGVTTTTDTPRVLRTRTQWARLHWR